MNSIYLSLSILVLPVLLTAQNSTLKIFPQDRETFSVNHIIENLILEGVDIVDLKTNFTVEQQCMAYFIDEQRSLGLQQGMVLSTGSAININRRSNETDYTSYAIDSSLLLKYIELSQTDSTSYKDSVTAQQEIIDELLNKSTTFSDEDLSQEIEGLETYDARVIEIEFIPTADTFYYRYVFASEEYDEYVCSAFNDIFAFYVYQEGQAKRNTALVPEKSIPVSINTINRGNPKTSSCTASNTYLFRANKGNKHILFDGYTKVLDIRFKVTPGEKYFIKIAIADASDQILDSAVLIEHKSIFSYFTSDEIYFSSNSYEIANYAKLGKVIQALQLHPQSKIQVVGHSDITGRAAHNMNLSIRRVEEVVRYLKSKGIEEERILAKFQGELMPRHNQHHLNRRVELFVLGE